MSHPLPRATCRRNLASRWRWRITAGVSGTLLILGMPAASADDAEDAGCPVVAAAQGVQVVASKSDDLLLKAPSGLSVPAAQSCVDYRVRDSWGFASNPYPGELVATTPGLLAGVTGAPVPGYPAYASSRYPSPQESRTKQPGYSLSSRSSETSSEADARSGEAQDAGGVVVAAATAKSRVDPTARTSFAIGTSDVQPLTINGVLRLGHTHSVASVKFGRDGEVVRRSQLTIGRTMVGDQVVEITPEGVKAAGQTVALPDAGPLRVLEQAGIRVSYLDAEQTSRGVLSAGIEILARQQDAQSGAAYTVRFTLGRSFASAADVERNPGESAERDSGDLDASDVPTFSDAGAGAAEGRTPARQTSRSSDSSGNAHIDVSPSNSSVPEVAPVAAPPVVESAPRAYGNPIDMGAIGSYFVIACGALALFASGTLLRLLGVRTRWTS